MEVTLLDHSQDPLGNIVIAARNCFGNSNKQRNYEEDVNLVKALIRNDHSPVEFAWCMWSIEGISRNCANQLNRYRHSSQAQESMRYVDVSNHGFIFPIKSLEVSDACKDLVDTCFKFYDKLLKAGVPKEDARYYLPLGTETNLKIAFNFRELRHILKQRLDKHAQWEVRAVALKMFEIANDKWPWLVEDIGNEYGLL